MNIKKLLVLVVNDMVIFPNNEVRIEYDNVHDKQMINIVENIEDNHACQSRNTGNHQECNRGKQ